MLSYLNHFRNRNVFTKLTMSQDEKVRRIYHWMTVNFKHKHADEFVKAKNYYDLTSTKAQKRIKNYKKKTLQNYQNGKLIFGGSSWSSFMAPYKARPNRRLHRSSRGGPLHRSAPKRPFLLNRAPHCKNDDLPL